VESSLPESHERLLVPVANKLLAGEPVALLAPRGSGKSTFLAALVGTLESGGRAEATLHDLRRMPIALRRLLEGQSVVGEGGDVDRARLSAAGLLPVEAKARAVVLLDSLERARRKDVHRLLRVLRGLQNELPSFGLPRFSVLLSGTEVVEEDIVAKESPFHAAERVPLPSLGESETAQLLAHETKAEVPSDCVKAVFHHTGGDPSLVRFVASLLRRRRVRRCTEEVVERTIAAAVQQCGRHRTLRDTVDRVGAEPDLLAALLGCLADEVPPPAEPLHRLCALGVLRLGEDSVQWRAPLWKDVFLHARDDAELDQRRVELLRLRRERDASRAEQDVTRAINETIARDPVPTLNDLLDRILAETRLLLPFDAGVVFLRHGEILKPRRALGHGRPDGKVLPDFTLPKGVPFAGQILEDEQPRLEGDVFELPVEKRPRLTDLGGGRSFRAYLGVPIRLGTRLEGVLDVVTEMPYAFEVSHKERLQHIADTVAIAIGRTRALEQATLFERLARHLLAANSPEQALETAADCALELTGADRAHASCAWHGETRLVERPPAAAPSDGTDPACTQIQPLQRDGRRLGELRVESTTPGSFSPETQAALLMVGQELTAALERLRLARQQRDRQRVLDELSELLVRETDTPNFLDAVVRRVAQGLSIEVVAVYRFDPLDNLLHRMAVSPRLEGQKDEVYGVYEPELDRLGRSLTGTVFQRGKPLLVSDVSQDARTDRESREEYERCLGHRLVHWLGVPLRFRERRLGVFCLMNRLGDDGELAPGGFSKEDQEWATILANHVAFSLVTMERKERQETFGRYVRDTMEAMDLRALGRRTAELLVSVPLRYRSAVLWLARDTGERVELVPWDQHGLLPEERGRLTEIEPPRWKKRKDPHVTRDIGSANHFGPRLRELAADAGLRSALCVPVVFQGGILGVVSVFVGPHYRFGRDERDFLSTAADNLASAVARVERQRVAVRQADAEAAMLAATNEGQLREQVSDRAADIVEAEAALLWMSAGDELECVAASPGTASVSASRGFAEWCLARQKPARVNGPGRITRHRAWTDAVRSANDVGLRSLLLVPLVGPQDDVLGVLEIRNRRGRRRADGFSKEDLQLAATLAGKLVDKIDHLRVQAKLVTEEGMLRELAHNLHSPLVSIRHLSRSLFEGRVEDEAEARRRLAIIHQENERFIRLWSDLLETWRVQAGRDSYSPSSFDLTDVVKQTVETSGLLLERAGLKLEMSLCRSPLLVHADQERCRDVLQLLLDNAIKYTSRQGRVLVRTSRRGDRVQVAVHDTGPGISQETRKALYDPFVQGREAKEQCADGLGLGFHLVKRYVDAMGGALSVRRRRAGGTSVSVSLPRRAGDNDDA